MVINVRTISTANAPMATQSFFITESWCTGEDSNLRSPLGAADLQSAAINHSATCARPAEQNAWPGIAKSAIKYQRTIQACGRSSGNTQRPARAATFARNLFSEAAAGFSSLGELCVLLGLLLLLRLAARSGFRIWSWRRDLNPRPSDYKSDALPAELRQRATCKMARAPIKHSSPCPLGQTLRLTQGLCPRNLTSNPRKTLKPFDFASNGDPQLATPAGPVAGDSAEHTRHRQAL